MEIQHATEKKQRTANNTYKKLAVHCNADTSVVHGNLVLRNYICVERRQLPLAANRYRLCN